MSENNLKMSSSPHIRSKATTSNIMMLVAIALLPASAFGVWNFGLPAFGMLVTTTVVAVLTEYIYEKLMHKKITINDWSAAVTGLLLGLNMPPTAMGFSMFSLDVPVTKTSSSILGFTKDEVAKMEPSACINCGRCVEACPSRLIPSRLADYAEHHDEEKFTKHEGLECMECGSCSFVCPAKRPLKQAIGSMRKIALANRRKKK